MIVRAAAQPDRWWAWRGPALLGLDGDARAPGDLAGFYFRETRYLSAFGLTIQGEPPVACSAAQGEASTLEFTFTYPPVPLGSGGGSGSGGQQRHRGLLGRGVDLVLHLRVAPSGFEALLRITSRWEGAALELGWVLDADYAPLGGEGPPAAREVLPDGLRFRSRGAVLPYATQVGLAWDGGGAGRWRATDRGLACDLPLARQRTATVRLCVTALDFRDPISPEAGRRREAALADWSTGRALVESPGPHPLVDAVNRGISDLGSLALLEGGPDEWLAPAAGVPLYLALFGRDALTAVWQSSLFDGGTQARAALARLARLQGRSDDPWRDEEPGRIVQQVRDGPRERRGETPYGRSYADQASPFDFLFALAHAYACSGDRGLLERHLGTAERILAWARERGDRDGDGFLEYETRSPLGPRHQGWKDSDNALVHADGSPARPPIAACEVQGYHHAALQVMAALLVVTGRTREGFAHARAARRLRARFDEAFWLEDEGCPALALDADKRPLRVASSNAGQCLATGIVGRARVPRLVERLFRPDLFSGWGIRTLSSRNPAYHPLDYHLGSVWLVENATLVFGLRRYGFDREAVRLAGALLDLARLWPGARVPECVGGYGREEAGHPGAYPRANVVQAWNQSAWPLILQSLLGLQPLAPLQTLLVDPVLPEGLPEVTVRGLRVGSAVATLRFRDRDVEILEREGTLHVVRQPPPESLRAGWGERLSALFRRPRRAPRR